MTKHDKQSESEFDDTTQTRRTLKSFTTELNDMTANILKNVAQITKLSGTKLFDPATIRSDIEAMQSRSRQLDDFIKTSKAGYKDIMKAQKDLALNTRLVNNKIKQLNDAVFLDTSKKYTEYSSKISQQLEDMKKSGNSSFFDTGEADEYINRIEELQQTFTDLASTQDLSADKLEQVNILLGLMDNTLKSITSSKKESEDLGDRLGGISDDIIKPFTSLTGIIDNIPIIGNSLSRILDTEGLTKTLKENITNTLRKSITKDGISVEGLKDGFVNTFKSMFSLIGLAMKTLFLNPMILGISATVGLVYGMWKIFSSIGKTSSEVAQTLGVGNAITSELSYNLKMSESNLINMGSSLESAIESAAALNTVLGNTHFVTVDASTAMAKMSDWTGATKETMAAIYSQMLGIQGATEKSAIASTQQLAAVANLSGIAPNILFKDIESNSELIATHLSKTPGALNKAIVSTRKLGLSLSQVDSIIESTMDFESSIEKEFKASVLLGKQLNFNSARQKIFNNDITGGIQDIMNQVGSLEEFNNMNMFQKKALADTLGMSAGELQKSLQYQSMLSKMYPNDANQQQKILDMLEGKESLDEKSLKNQISYQSAISDIKNSFASILPLITESLIPAAKEFFGWISKEETKNMIKDTVIGLGDMASALVSIVGFFSKAGMLGLALLGTITMMIPKLITMAAIQFASGSPFGAGVGSYMSKLAYAGLGVGLGTTLGGGGTYATLGSVAGSVLGGLAGAFIPGAQAFTPWLMSGGGALGGYLAGMLDTPVKDGILRGNIMHPISNEDDVMALKSGGPIGNALSNKEADSSESTKVLSDKLDKIATLLSQLKIDVMLDGKKVGYGISKAQILPRGGY